VTYRDGDGAVDEIDAASAEDQPGLEGWPTSIGVFVSNLLAARLQMAISLGFTSSSRWSELLCLATVVRSLVGHARAAAGSPMRRGPRAPRLP
jgi:hypothetical protein